MIKKDTHPQKKTLTVSITRFTECSIITNPQQHLNKYSKKKKYNSNRSEQLRANPAKGSKGIKALF